METSKSSNLLKIKIELGKEFDCPICNKGIMKPTNSKKNCGNFLCDSCGGRAAVDPYVEVD